MSLYIFLGKSLSLISNKSYHFSYRKRCSQHLRVVSSRPSFLCAFRILSPSCPFLNFPSIYFCRNSFSVTFCSYPSSISNSRYLFACTTKVVLFDNKVILKDTCGWFIIPCSPDRKEENHNGNKSVYNCLKTYPAHTKSLIGRHLTRSILMTLISSLVETIFLLIIDSEFIYYYWSLSQFIQLMNELMLLILIV